MICVSVFAGVYVVGFSTEEVENEGREALRHIERNGDTGTLYIYIHNNYLLFIYIRLNLCLYKNK